MKIELKSIRHNERLSDETHAYSANLYVDGRKIGTVSNAGHGGPDDFHGDRVAYEAAQSWISKNMAPCDLGSGSSIPMDIEILCSDLVNDWLMRRELAKSLKRYVVFLKPGDEFLSQISWKGVSKVTDNHIRGVAARYPGATILNSLHQEESLEIFRKYT